MKTTPYTFKVFERLNIPTILPENANYERGIVIRDLRKKLELTQDELQELEFKSARAEGEKFTITWKPEKDVPKEFPLTELEVEVVKLALARLNKDEKLPTEERWIALYEQFIPKD